MSELRTLHDDLPPMEKEHYEIVMARAFGEFPFVSFNSTPIASASIGQVHEAWLDDKTKVAVKLRRYGIEKRVKADILIINWFNYMFRPLFSNLTRHSIESVIAEFSSMIAKECSLNHERANLEKFSAVYAGFGIVFPTPYPVLSSDDALVMSFESGCRFDDIQSVKSKNIDIHKLIVQLVEFYTEQMLVKGYFHADPHPGNLLINEDGRLILLDFGMVKKIPNETRVAIIELIKYANERDFEGYVSAAKRLGTVAYDAPSTELSEFTERMFDIFGNDALDSGSMQKLAFDVLEQTRNLPFKLPQEAIYILRVSAIIEGLGTTYIDNFNGIKDILPILQKNIPRALGLKGSIVSAIFEELKRLPVDLTNLRHALDMASKGELKMELSKLQYSQIKQDISEATKPIVVSLLLALGSFAAWMGGFVELSYVLVITAMVRLLIR